MTDLEDRLSARLHREAAQLVPDTTLPPPLPHQARPAASRWRAPLLVAGAVVVVALGVTVTVQAHRDDSTAPVAAHTSPVLTSPAPAFPCFDATTSQQVMTLHAARAGMFRIGITADAFCATADIGSSTGGSSLRPSGALRSWVSDELGVAGVVDPSVDRVVWIPEGTDEKSGTTLNLYSLGQLNGFAVGIQSSGTLVVYSGSSELAREQIPFPGQGPAAASSSPATATYPSTPAGEESKGRTQAVPSYPPGQGPTAKPGVWPTNARGQTYGSAGDANGVTGEPDLIAAVATNGKTGYVLRTDLELPSPANTSEALALNTAASRTIPVYQSDGLTKIGVFVIAGATGTDTAAPPGDIITNSAATNTR